MFKIFLFDEVNSYDYERLPHIESYCTAHITDALSEMSSTFLAIFKPTYLPPQPNLNFYITYLPTPPQPQFLQQKCKAD